MPPRWPPVPNAQVLQVFFERTAVTSFRMPIFLALLSAYRIECQPPPVVICACAFVLFARYRFRLQLLLLLDFGPGITQGYSAIKHRHVARQMQQIKTEVTFAFKLKIVTRLCLVQARLNKAPG